MRTHTHASSTHTLMALFATQAARRRGPLRAALSPPQAHADRHSGLPVAAAVVPQCWQAHAKLHQALQPTTLSELCCAQLGWCPAKSCT